MNQLFVKFVEEFNNNKIAFIKRKPNTYEIHVVANDDEFNLWEQLKRINELLLSNVNLCSWKKIILEEWISTKKNYSSSYIFRSKKKDMASVSAPKKSFVGTAIKLLTK